MGERDELLLQTTADAPWLPPGGRAQVIRRRHPPQPMCLVRLLLRRGGQVFCVPRADTGKLDLPTKSVHEGDLEGSAAISALVARVTGAWHDPTFVGAVRNIVDSPSTGYAWPTPLAHFGVWSAEADPVIDGTWISVEEDTSVLANRHWYPLLSRVG